VQPVCIVLMLTGIVRPDCHYVLGVPLVVCLYSIPTARVKNSTHERTFLLRSGFGRTRAAADEGLSPAAAGWRRQ